MNAINTHRSRYLIHTVGLDGPMVAQCFYMDCAATTRLLEDLRSPSSV
jgi:hypothetical protein